MKIWSILAESESGDRYVLVADFLPTEEELEDRLKAELGEEYAFLFGNISIQEGRIWSKK